MLWKLASLVLAAVTPALAIVGGEVVADSKLGFTVALLQQGVAASPRLATTFLCDGVLISESVVITAAECTTGLRPKDIAVRSGLTPATQQNATVSEIFLLQRLNYATLNRNIAVLRLETPLTNVVPAELAVPEPPAPDLPEPPPKGSVPRPPVWSNNSSPLNGSFPYNGSLPLNGSLPFHRTERRRAADPGGRVRFTPIRIAGWGPTTNHTQAINSQLTWAHVDKIEPNTCAEELSTCGFTLDPEEKLCTSSDPKGAAAFGDVGGPVVDEQNVVVAVISGNPICAQPYGIGLKLKVTDESVSAFIKKHLDPAPEHPTVYT